MEMPVWLLSSLVGAWRSFSLPLPPVPSLYILHLTLIFTKRELWGVCLVGGLAVLLSHMELTYTLYLTVPHPHIKNYDLWGVCFQPAWRAFYIYIHYIYTLLIQDFRQLMKTLFLMKLAQKCPS
jgi:hypothetical protein